MFWTYIFFIFFLGFFVVCFSAMALGLIPFIISMLLDEPVANPSDQSPKIPKRLIRGILWPISFVSLIAFCTFCSVYSLHCFNYFTANGDFSNLKYLIPAICLLFSACILSGVYGSLIQLGPDFGEEDNLNGLMMLVNMVLAIAVCTWVMYNWKDNYEMLNKPVFAWIPELIFKIHQKIIEWGN